MSAFILTLGMASNLRGQGADAAAAESLFRDGKRLLEQQSYAQACPKFAESFRLDPATGTLLALAMCHEGEGKTASSWAEYADVAARSKNEGREDREKAAREAVALLQPKLSMLAITISESAVKTPGLEVKRDGMAVGAAAWGTAVPVDPGEHLIEVVAPGKKPWQTRVTVGANSDRQTVIWPPPAETPSAVSPTTSTSQLVSPDRTDTGGRPNSLRIAAYAAAGAGLVAAGTATAFVLRSNGKRRDADTAFAQCGSPCLEGNPHAVEVATLDDQARSAKTVATVAFVIGGVGAAAGVALFFLSNRKSGGDVEAGTVRAWVAPGSLGVRGIF